MTTSVGVGGAYKTVAKKWAGVGGAWKSVAKGWVGVGGVWKVFYQAVDPTIVGGAVVSVTDSPEAASATYTISNGGTESSSPAGISNTWLPPAEAAGDYEVFATLTGGALTSGTTGAWLNLATSRAWNVTQSSPAPTSSASLSLQLRRVADGVVVDTAAVTLSANMSP